MLKWSAYRMLIDVKVMDTDTEDKIRTYSRYY